ncbi:MAG: thioredoxin family protein [Candidatus Omnitrophota bacterium]
MIIKQIDPVINIDLSGDVRFSLRGDMKIEVFGPGCPKCAQLEKVVKEALLELNITAEVEKVKDMGRIVEAGIMLPPGLSINGKLKSSGKVPKIDEIKRWIEEAKEP